MEIYIPLSLYTYIWQVSNKHKIKDSGYLLGEAG